MIKSVENIYKLGYVFKHLFPDLLSDFRSIFAKPDAQTVCWINGQAKSGTSLVEHVADKAGFIDALRSPLRSYHKCEGYRNGEVCIQLFRKLPVIRKSFVKTHACYSAEIDAIMEIPHVSLVLTNRRLEDTLISRFYHVTSDPKHWQYSNLKRSGEDKRTLFKRSILERNPHTGISSLEYFGRWSDSWLTSKFGTTTLWYEDYLNDPELWLGQLLLKIGGSSRSAREIEYVLREFRMRFKRNSQALGARRRKFGPLSGTFRRGQSNTYEDYFDQESFDAINDLRTRYVIDKLAE